MGPAPRGAGARRTTLSTPPHAASQAGPSGHRFHKSVWVLGTRPTVRPECRDSDATEPPDHLRRRAPLVARCPVDGPARPRRGPAAEKSRTRTRSPYTPPRTEGRTNAFITFPAPNGSLRKPHGNTLLYCTDIGNCDFAVALYCRVSTTFYDYVSLSTCVKSSSEDRSGSAPLDVVYVRSASHGSTEGRSSPWPPIPKGTYASFSSSPSS